MYVHCVMQQPSHMGLVSYEDAYPPSSLQNVKVEPGLQQVAVQQVKTEPTALLDYAGDYYVGDEENDHENYDMYCDQADSMYMDPGGSYSSTGQFADNSAQIVEHSKPRAQKVLLLELSLFVG